MSSRTLTPQTGNNLCRSGVRKQFLIAGGRTIFGFVSKQGGKFRNCTCATERTGSAQRKVKQVRLRWGLTFTQALAGLSEVSLASSSKSTRKAGGRAILKASPCQWIDLEKVREEGNGCVDGSKFVVSKERGVSKQFEHQCKQVHKVKSLKCSSLGFET